MNVLDVVIGSVFAASALLAVFRIVRGPSILDRMIASDVLLTTLILVIGAEMVYNDHTRNIPMMVVLAGTAVFATIAVARYVSKQDLKTTEGVPVPAQDAPLQNSQGEATQAQGTQAPVAQDPPHAQDPQIGRDR